MDVTSLSQKFVVGNIANKIVTEGNYIQIFNASNGLESNLPVTYSCYFGTRLMDLFFQPMHVRVYQV